MASVEIGCKSDQQGCQSTFSEQNTFYLVLIDALADALHSAYCYQKNWSSSARQIAETQLAAALGLWTRLPGTFTVARYGMLQSLSSVTLGMLFHWETDFWFNVVEKRPKGLCVEEDIFWVMQTHGAAALYQGGHCSRDNKLYLNSSTLPDKVDCTAARWYLQ